VETSTAAKLHQTSMQIPARLHLLQGETSHFLFLRAQAQVRTIILTPDDHSLKCDTKRSLSTECDMNRQGPLPTLAPFYNHQLLPTISYEQLPLRHLDKHLPTLHSRQYAPHIPGLSIPSSTHYKTQHPCK